MAALDHSPDEPPEALLEEEKSLRMETSGCNQNNRHKKQLKKFN